MNKTKALSLLIVIFILLIALIVIFFVDFNQPYNSYLSIDNTKILMGQKDLLTVITDNKEYYIKPNSNFLQLFNEKEWKEVKVKDESENKPTLTIIIQDNEHELVFYTNRFLASITYYDKTEVSKKWYKVPSDICTIIENYIVENGVTKP